MHAIVVAGSGCPWTTNLFLFHICLQTSSTFLETVQPRFHMLFSNMHHLFVNRNGHRALTYLLHFYTCWSSTSNGKAWSIKLILLGLCIYPFTDGLGSLSLHPSAFLLITGCLWELFGEGGGSLGARTGFLYPIDEFPSSGTIDIGRQLYGVVWVCPVQACSVRGSMFGSILGQCPPDVGSVLTPPTGSTNKVLTFQMPWG